MRIAILGATSQIAKDLILSFAAHGSYELELFSRRTAAVTEWLHAAGWAGQYPALSFDDFDNRRKYDAILNFVGVGNPVQAVAMGASIFDVTLQYDQLALNYLRYHPECRYIFLSSGAAYGSNFAQPVDGNSVASVSINHLQPQDWYAAAKLHAECRHRSLPSLPIVDIRVFNYFSHTLDMSSRFFITDVMRAIQSRMTLQTSADNIVRDYIGPTDFYHLISKILTSGPINDVVDCYTQAPVEKVRLLNTMSEQFGLRYEFSTAPAGVNATGLKLNYFSKNRRAEIFGYKPLRNSLETILHEIRTR